MKQKQLNILKPLLLPIFALTVMILAMFTISNQSIFAEAASTDPHLREVDVTYEEYVDYINMLAFEVDRMGGLQLPDVESVDDAMDGLHDAVFTASDPPGETIQLGEKTLTQEEYALLKAELLLKFQ